jgi:hypothetical protein
VKEPGLYVPRFPVVADHSPTSNGMLKALVLLIVMLPLDIAWFALPAKDMNSKYWLPGPFSKNPRELVPVHVSGPLMGALIPLIVTEKGCETSTFTVEAPPGTVIVEG